MRSPHRGFTLIELLLVITILVIILGAIFVFVDPVRRFNMTRNAVRRTDSAALAKAISFDLSDEEGSGTDASRLVKRKWKHLGKDTQGCSISCGDLGRSTTAVRFDAGAGTASGDMVVPWQSDLDLSVVRPFSITFWARPTQLNTGILSKDLAGGGRGYAVFSYTSGELIFLLFEAPRIQLVVAEHIFTPGTFTHVAIVQNGGNIMVYKDGTPVDVAQTPVDFSFAEPQPAPLHIGSVGGDAITFFAGILSTFFGGSGVSPYHGTSFFLGTLDDVRIFSGALPAEDVQRVQKGGEQLDPSVITIAHWMLDEGEGKAVEDSSDFTHDGRLNNAVQWVHDGPLLTYALPNRCIDVEPELASLGYLPSVPIGPATDEVTPTAGKTYYIARNRDGIISVRSCLSEGEGRQGGGAGPPIEVSH